METQQLAEFLSGLLTKEVITVFGSLLALFLGFRACKAGWNGTCKVASGAASMARSIGWMGVLAGSMFLGGLGVTGFGIGELSSWEEPAEVNGDFTTDQLMQMASNDDVSVQDKQAVLEYVAKRNSTGFTNEQLLELHAKNNMQIAELIADQKSKGVELSPDQITALFKANSIDSILGHIQTDSVDQQTYTSNVAPSPEVSSTQPVDNSNRMPLWLDWSAVLAGIGMVIMGMVTYIVNQDKDSTVIGY